MDSTESLKKVLQNYKLVADDPELDEKLIERVVKIITKEFDLKPKFDVDDGPIALATKTAVAKSSSSSTAQPAVSARSNNSNQQHFQNVTRQIVDGQSPAVRAKAGAAPPASPEEEVDVNDDASVDDSDGVETIDEVISPQLAAALPKRLNQVESRSLGKNNSIRRASQ